MLIGLFVGCCRARAVIALTIRSRRHSMRLCCSQMMPRALQRATPQASHLRSLRCRQQLPLQSTSQFSIAKRNSTRCGGLKNSLPNKPALLWSVVSDEEEQEEEQ